MPLLVSILGSVFGGIVASLLAIYIWESWRRPNVAVEIPPRGDNEPSIQSVGQTSRAFYHLNVRNRGRTPAYNARIAMRFMNNEGTELFSVAGKWDRGPQPLLYMPVPVLLRPNGVIESPLREVPHDFLVPFAETIDVYPGSPETFCVLVKYDNDADCYAFSAWSYIMGQGHRVNQWRLGQGTYAVEIKLSYSGKESVERLRLTNLDETMRGVALSKPDC